MTNKNSPAETGLSNEKQVSSNRSREVGEDAIKFVLCESSDRR